jgi:hypothetical protein
MKDARFLGAHHFLRILRRSEYPRVRDSQCKEDSKTVKRLCGKVVIRRIMFEC